MVAAVRCGRMMRLSILAIFLPPAPTSTSSAGIRYQYKGRSGGDSDALGAYHRGYISPSQLGNVGFGLGHVSIHTPTVNA